MNGPVKVLAHQAFGRTVTRRSLLAAFSAAGIGMVATGCGKRDTVAANIAPDGKLEGKLNIYTWGDYDDPALISQFGSDNDLVVQVDSYGSNEELQAKLGASRGTSGYDIVVPTGLEIPAMVKHQLIQKLDRSRIPNFEKLDPAFTGQYYDPKNEYSVCKAWGTTGYVYDNTKITKKLTSWQDFIDAAAGPASGKTALLEDPWEVAAIGLAAAGHDLNTSSADELRACKKLIVDDLAPHVKTYTRNAATAMAQGGFSLIHAFNGDARQGVLEDADPDRWTYVFPTPTANLWIDNWCLATGAPHPDAAHAFINWIIAPEQAMKEVDYIGYPTGAKIFNDPAVEEKFDIPDLIFPADDIIKRLTPSERKGGQQERIDIYTSAQARSGA